MKIEIWTPKTFDELSRLEGPVCTSEGHAKCMAGEKDYCWQVNVKKYKEYYQRCRKMTLKFSEIKEAG